MSEAAIGPGNTDETQSSETELTGFLPKLRKYLRYARWGAFALGCLLFFIIMKMPVFKVKNFIEGTIAASLNPYGITYSAKSSSLSFLFGIRYTLKGVTLRSANLDREIVIDKVQVSPNLLPLLIGRQSISASVRSKYGDADLTASLRKREVDLALETSDFNPLEMGLGKLLTGLPLNGRLKVNADVSLSGDLQFMRNVSGQGTITVKDLDVSEVPLQGGNLPKLGAKSIALSFKANNSAITQLKLSVKDLKSDKFSLQGLGLPDAAISSIEVDAEGKDQKLVFKTLKIGEKPEDDLRGTGKGEIELPLQNLMAGRVDLKTRLTLSDKVYKKLTLIDLFLKDGKRADGSYGIVFSGPMGAVAVAPTQE
ncbi:MAG: type II secretion system protein GspN [Bacteriovoracia bacterium]